jgi:hypothetical protein
MATFLNPRGHKTPYGEFPTVSVDDGWPAGHLIARPNDKLGQAIIDYAKRWRSHPDFPESPWDDRRGEIFLRDLDKPRPATDEQPRYRLKDFGAVGGTVYAAGSELNFPGWPTRPSLLEPINESAERVIAYMISTAGRPLPAAMPHNGFQLNLPSPGLDGVPQNYTHRGTFGQPSAA